MTFEKIKRSLKYGALDHKWLARDYLWEQDPKAQDRNSYNENEEFLYQTATSAFKYYNKYRKVFESDISLKAITELCSDELLTLDTEHNDSQVFHLSNVFNQIIESARKLHRCYDCGTNARAIFLKLIEIHRGRSYITFEEQQRMKDEYSVTHDNVAKELDVCYQRLLLSDQESVFIMSLSLQDFGHVWVIEKRFIDGRPRYHHYQSSFKSHLLLDFIEHKDYGKNLHQSLDIKLFFNDLRRLLLNKNKWTEPEYYLFAKMFSFLPVYDVVNPNPGFCYTSISY